ncbi:hypothetical protein [Streptomyces sp. BRA346]|uniref:hypothetical protein n=1 Tax=Streptomyces sp. BRA346 TaxID=2878199 RepID=UPI004062E636
MNTTKREALSHIGGRSCPAPARDGPDAVAPPALSRDHDEPHRVARPFDRATGGRVPGLPHHV